MLGDVILFVAKRFGVFVLSHLPGEERLLYTITCNREKQESDRVNICVSRHLVLRYLECGE